MTRRTGEAITFLMVLSVLSTLAGCDLPFSEVERPSFDNPMDPNAHVPIEDVIARIQVENSNPVPLVEAILAHGARYNTDVEELWLRYTDFPVTDLTGVLYLPRMRRFSLWNDSAGGNVLFTGFLGHQAIEEIEAIGFEPSVVQSIPPLPGLRRLDVSETIGTGVDFSLMYEQNLEELIARDAGIDSLAGIERLGSLKTVDIRGVANSYTDDDLMNELIALADSLEMIRSTAPISIGSFIASYPVLTGFGFEFTSGEALDATILGLVAGYSRIEAVGFYGFSTVTGLEHLSSSGIVELELHQGGGGPGIDVSPLSNLPLRRINLSSFSSIVGIESLPTSVEEISFIDVGLSDTNGELQVLASTFPSLRFLDISRNIQIQTLLPLSNNAATLVHLEEFRADQDHVGVAPPDPYGIGDDRFANGIMELSALSGLRFLSLRNSRAAYGYTINGTDIGLDSLLQAVPELDADAFYEF